MNYLVIVCAIISIVLIFLSKLYKLSVVYPSLMIILTIILDIVSNTIRKRKENKEYNSIKDKVK